MVPGSRLDLSDVVPAFILISWSVKNSGFSSRHHTFLVVGGCNELYLINILRVGEPAQVLFHRGIISDWLARVRSQR